MCKIFNKSTEEGECPFEFKLARVIALYKKGRDLLTDNYRPIGLLSCFNKIVKKLLCKQLLVYIYFESNCVLYEFQFGFRKWFSTSLALFESTDNIQWHIDEGNYVLGIYVDLTKAFDRVDHDFLCINYQTILFVDIQTNFSCLT